MYLCNVHCRVHKWQIGCVHVRNHSHTRTCIHTSTWAWNWQEGDIRSSKSQHPVQVIKLKVPRVYAGHHYHTSNLCVMRFKFIYWPSLLFHGGAERTSTTGSGAWLVTEHYHDKPELMQRAALCVCSCIKSQQQMFIPLYFFYFPPRKKSLMLKKFAISFLEEREAFPLWCLQSNLLSIDCYLSRSRQAELHPPAESISLFVMALLESLLLETKLYSANGLRVTGADIRAIMISLCVYMHRWSVRDMGLCSNNSDHTCALWY